MTANASNEQIRRALERRAGRPAPAWEGARAAWADLDPVQRARLMPDGAPLRVSYTAPDTLDTTPRAMLGACRGIREFEGREYLHIGILTGLGDEAGPVPIPLDELVELAALSDLELDRVDLPAGPVGYQR